jgi:hypothetical protein
MEDAIAGARRKLIILLTLAAGVVIPAVLFFV